MAPSIGTHSTGETGEAHSFERTVEPRWRRSPAFALLLSALVGALVWAISPLAVGRVEPWDADGPYYVIALFGGGVLAGTVAPRPLWAHYLGAWLGQLGYQLVFLPIGSLIVLGAVLLFGYSLVFALGVAIATRLRARIARRSDSW